MIENVVEVIKEELTKTFPNPHLILENLVVEGEYILLGSNDVSAYISYFKLSEKANGRYYPEYKNFNKDFNDKNGLLDYERFIKDIFDPLKYKIIYDKIYFESLNL